MKNKIVLVFISVFFALLLFQSCNIETEIVTTSPTITEATEFEITKNIIENTEATFETIEETIPSYMDADVVAEEMKSRYGMIGRLIVPSIGVDVALFNTYTQGTVDKQDSAGTYRYNGGQIVVADHKNQGFEAIKLSIPNETVAYINYGDVIMTYICVDNNVGTNKANGIPYDLLDCNGESIYLQNEGGLCMYTCNQHWSNITYTYWQPVKE